MSQTVTVRSIRDGIECSYAIVYAEPSKERAEAVHFFKTLGTDSTLAADTDWLEDLKELPIEEANVRLRENPVVERYKLLLAAASEMTDADLSNVRHIPELQIVRIFSERVTDSGVEHLRHLHQVRVLELHTPRITDACLATLRELRSLEMLDLQMCPNLTQDSCEALQAGLPQTMCWLTFRGPTNSSTRRAKTHARDE